MPDAPNTWQVEINQSLYGRPLQNVVNFVDLVGLSLIRADALGQMISDWLINRYKLNFSTSLTFTHLRIRSLVEATPYDVLYVNDFPFTGTLDQGAEAVNVAMKTTFFTGFAGRAYKGRVYSSGLPVQDRSGGTWSTTRVSSVEDDWNFLITSAPIDDFGLVVVSRQLNLVERDPYVSTPVLGAITSLNVHDMGRRLDNVSTL